MRNWLTGYGELSLQRLWRDERGQDMIEYALVAAAGFLAIAVVIPEQLAPLIRSVFTKVIATLLNAGNQGV